MTFLAYIIVFNLRDRRLKNEVQKVDSKARTIRILDAHRDNGKRFVVRADEKLTAFVELESAVEPFSASSFL